MSIFKILQFISHTAALITLIIALINYRHIRGCIKPIFYYVVISVIIEVLVFALNALSYPIVVVLHAYTVIEFLLISLFYIAFLKNYFRPVLMYLVIGLFVLATVFFYSTLKLQLADHYDMDLECFIFTCYCLYLYYFLLKHLMFDNLTETPVFWMNTGIMFYFTGNFTIFIFSSYVSSSPNESDAILWQIIHTFFNVAMNILFSIGFWKTRVK